MGRKRHLLVDTLGLPVTVLVHPANVQDRDGAVVVFRRTRCSRLRVIRADGAYAGERVRQAGERAGWTIEVVDKPKGQKTFVVLPIRWIVERTFAWLGKYRRLSKDYEATLVSSRAMILIALINLMIHRLALG